MKSIVFVIGVALLSSCSTSIKVETSYDDSKIEIIKNVIEHGKFSCGTEYDPNKCDKVTGTEGTKNGIIIYTIGGKGGASLDGKIVVKDKKNHLVITAKYESGYGFGHNSSYETDMLNEISEALTK